MVSKIIQKEKDRQIGYLEQRELKWMDRKALCSCHQQSLINLKDYMEEEVNNITGFIGDQDMFYKISRNISNDTDELTKMIEKYK